jgi:hypothetical protein
MRGPREFKPGSAAGMRHAKAPHLGGGKMKIPAAPAAPEMAKASLPESPSSNKKLAGPLGETG